MAWEPEPGDVVDGRYAVEETLGKGGFAKVLLATDRETGDAVALKYPNYTETQNDRAVVEKYFEKEAETLEHIAAAGGHDRVMGYYGRVEHRGVPFLVVELVDGLELDEAVDRHGPEDDPDVVRTIGIALAEAMAFLHENEVVYRDLKPENLMATASGTTKLIDFNTAARFGGDTAETSAAGGTTILGPYKPREVAEASRTDLPQGPWSDVYSIGKILMFALRGTVPRKDGVDPRDFGVDCPDYLAAIVERATQSHPKDRYANATVLKTALENRDPSPPDPAVLRYVTGDGEYAVKPGDTIGRRGVGPSTTIEIEDPVGTYVSAVHAQFTVEDGDWYLEDKSLNGTYVQRGDGWQRVLSEAGYEGLRRSEDVDPTDGDGGRPPTSVRLHDGDLIALVDASYGVSFEFHTE
ncbi:serine/threonine protein kinase [Haloarcula litorea]|uniref:serine/threonine protein kinase n=1 Tax=Haloarcula litorea TaxID=3032579 RepID=UPI0023E8E865|nr:FHA domain-containing serine/threonine-protein kinase [Halomicroarcula sp. GDY20]